MEFSDNFCHGVLPDTVSSGTGKARPPAAGEARQGRGTSLLGKDAKSVDQKARNEAAKAQRSKAFALQRTAAKLLPEERVGQCRWAVISKAAGVDVHLTKYDGGAIRASFSGLQTCGSVWLCPCCTRRISETRRGELNTMLAWAREQGLRPIMLTLTARHAIDDDLATQLDAMKRAKQRLRQRREWRGIKDRIAGSVSATEVTHGKNGWHTHFHEILLITPTEVEVLEESAIRARLAEMPKSSERSTAFDAEAKRIEAEAVAVLHGLDKVWLACLTGVGLSGGKAAWHVQGAVAAGKYVSKWGAAEEMTLTGAKLAAGKGRTPSQVLADAHDGDEEAAQIWRVYGMAFKGRRQLVWSPGLKARAGIGEVDDQEAAQDVGQDDAEVAPILHIDHSQWVGRPGRIGAKHRRARILDAAEAGGASAAATVVKEYDRSDLQDRLHERLIEPLAEPVIDRRPYRPRPGGLVATALAAAAEARAVRAEAREECLEAAGKPS